MQRILCLAWGLCLFSVSGVAAETWNQFRGPGGSGVAEATTAPIAPEHRNRAWTTHIPFGLSSPVMSETRVMVTGISDGRFQTLALDKEIGQVVWQATAPEVELEKVHAAGSPAASTPHVDAAGVYVFFGSFGLLCYDHQGRERWRKPVDTPKSLYGNSTSLVGDAQRLYLVLDDERNLPDSKLTRSKVIAIDKRNGDTLWETARPMHRSGWSTPTLWQKEDGVELVVLGQGRVASYAADTGEERWFANGFSRETIAVPVIGNGKVYASAAMLGGVPDEHPDPQPFWAAVVQFDADKSGSLTREEMTAHFTFPFRPELNPAHPGYGMPMPKEPAKRKARLDSMFAQIDRNKDGQWTKEEFLARLNFNRGKPTLMAIEPGGVGDVGESKIAWRLHQSIPEVPSPLFYQDRLYMVRNGGFLSSVNASTGELVYRERLGASGPYSASPVLANGHLYLLSERGVLTVVKAGEPFEKVHQLDLRERTSVTPAFDATSLYVRIRQGLTAFRSQQNMPASSEESYVGSYFKNGEIHVNQYGSEEGRPLTSGHQDFKPSWSKTGDMLVFFRRLKSDPVVVNWITQMCVINVDGTGFHTLTDGTHTDFNQTWTRDGKNTPIWNRKNPETGRFYVMQSKVGGKPGEEVALTGKGYHSWAYSSLVDGRILVQSKPPGQAWGYFLMTRGVQGAAPSFERIDCELIPRGLLDRVSVSPSETKICFEFQEGRKYDNLGRTLFIADFDVAQRKISNILPIANEEGKRQWYAYPRWTKDESAIVYHANKAGKGALFLYTLKDGSTRKVSTDDGADYRYPHCEDTPK